MKLLGIKKLASLKGESVLIDRWVSSWVSEVTHASWKQAKDVSEQFPTVTVVDGALYLFSIERTGIEVWLKIAFAQGIAIITELSRKP